MSREPSTIHHGEALEVLASLPEKSIDGVITDPPYCSGGFTESSRMQAQYQGLKKAPPSWFLGDNMGTTALMWILRGVAFEALRLMRGPGSMLIFTDWRMVPNLTPAISSVGWRFSNLIVWDKKAAGLGHGFRARHELILHFTVGAAKYHDEGAANVIACSRENHRTRVHPTEKPVELMEALVGTVIPPGGTVLDPFGGSGTTAVAAEKLGRRAVLVERDAGFCDTARERLASLQQALPFE